MRWLWRHLGVLSAVISMIAFSPTAASAADLPDLQPTRIAATTVYSGADNTITAVINNNTNAAAEGFTVRLEVDGKETATSTGNYISGNEDPYYWPLSINFNWVPEKAGDYTLKISVDPENGVTEPDENNNEITQDMTVIDLTGITVKIRIEGQDSTIWSGEAALGSSTITDKQGDSHTIDHPTVLGALQAAADAGGFNYIVSSAYGTCSFIESIAGESNSGPYGWLYTVNWRGADCAAVDYAPADGDEVLWYYGGWSAQPLKLTADKLRFSSDDEITFRVETYDGAAWNPVEGATIYGGQHIYTTDAEGQAANISFSPGGYTVYAQKETYPTYIRSNTLDIAACIPLGLKPGWNFISVPKRLKEGYAAAGELFRDVDTAGHSILAFDPQNIQNGWRAMSAEEALSPLEGIWIYSTAATTVYPIFDSDPVQSPSTNELASGWNAIGFTDFSPATANTALTSVEGKWAYLIGFEAETQSYEVSIINNAPDSDAHSESRLMEPWKGYWLYMTGDGELAAISN
jgi:hypothetical protein